MNLRSELQAGKQSIYRLYLLKSTFELGLELSSNYDLPYEDIMIRGLLIVVNKETFCNVLRSGSKL